MSIRLFGAGIVLTSALTVSGNLTLRQGVTNYSANFSTTMAAGVYDLFSFSARFNNVLRQALITNKHASITAPALASVLFKVVFPTTWSATPNANKLVMTFDPTGFVVTAGSLQTTINSFTIDNLTGHKVLTKLGMVAESTTSNATITVYTPASPSATLATLTGLFQPRSIFCFENSCRDTWDSEVRPLEATIQLRDGKIKRWSQGSMEAYREIVLVDLPAHITGYPYDAAQFATFTGNRLTLTKWVPDLNGLTNMSNISTNPGLVAGDLVRIGADDFWARVLSVSASTVTAYEFWPTTLDPSAGDSIWKISEAHALWIEAYRTNYFFVFEPDESTTGGSNFKALAYKLNLNGKHELNFQRLDQYVNLYSVVYPLTRANTPETVIV